MARFHISSDGEQIAVEPLGATPPDTVSFLLEHQVTPLVESKRGRLVMHGSSIAHGGRAIALIGPSGAGKSTLAASFAVSGSPFLADDALYLQREPTQYFVQSSRASLRLWSDSRERLLGENFPLAPALGYTEKEHLHACAEVPHCEHALPLAAIYFLQEAQGDDIGFTRHSRRDAALALMRNSFLLDVESREEVASHFTGFADVAESVPCFALTFPRKYSKLPAVRAAIEAHVDALCDARGSANIPKR